MAAHYDPWKALRLGLRWSARVLSIIATIVLLMFLFGEPFNVAAITWKQWIGFAIFPLGMVIGFAIAWWRETFGGALTVACVLLISLMAAPGLRAASGFLLFGIPGVLFLLSGLLNWRTLTMRTSQI